MFHLLSWLHVLKQQFIKLASLNLYMGQVKQIEIENQTFYFYNDKISLKNFESNLLKIDKNITKALIFTTLDTSQLK